jgi:uncharacterized protein
MNKLSQAVQSNAECEKMIQGTFQGVLTMVDGDAPYALPVNHAYADGKFYFHCAASGKKLDLIAQNPNVSYVISKYYGDPELRAKSMRCHGLWESVIASGKARVITSPEELISTFKTYLSYYGRDDFQPSETTFEKTRIIVVDVESMTARREYEDEHTDFWVWER